MLIGMPVAYFLIAPTRFFGMNMGAIGLAVKMVTMQFIVVNVHLYFNAKFLKLSFWKYFGHQIFIIAFLLLTALFTCHFTNYMVSQWKETIRHLLMSGILYTLVVGSTVCLMPNLFGLKRDDIRGLRRFFRDDET